MANQEHLAILKQGLETWNQWRQERLDRYLGTRELDHVDLSEADLRGADLRYADLRKVNLSKALLSDAHLSDASLNGADLSDASLSRADLSGARLWRATLIRADLFRAKLIGAELNGATLSYANLNRADLSRASGGARLNEADLSGADLSYADLRGSDLSGARLSKAHLSGLELLGATLPAASQSAMGIDAPPADLRNANLSHTNLSGAKLIRAYLSEANLNGADLSGADLSYANFSRADLSGADLSGARVEWTTFTNLDLRSVKGLETIEHSGPSSIGIDTVYRSQGQIPESFLRQAGVPEDFLTYLPSLMKRATEYYTCFISYSSRDEAFAHRLYADLQAKGVLCWFAPEDMKIGDKIRPRIEESIRLYDKLLLVLSEYSITSNWVAYEVEQALNKEPEGIPSVLYPIRLDDAVMKSKARWADDIRRTRHIGDFTHWTNHDDYQKAFNRLLRALKAEAQKMKS